MACIAAIFDFNMAAVNFPNAAIILLALVVEQCYKLVISNVYNFIDSLLHV